MIVETNILTKEDSMNTMEDIFGEVISTYTRAQAIEDGVLVDMNQKEFNEISRQHYKYPIACTIEVFSIMEKVVTAKNSTCDYKGIWHDVCWIARSPLAKVVDETTRLFQVKIGRKKHIMKMVCGPNDDMSPCLTVMLKDQD